jgi:hypothetical protein
MIRHDILALVHPPLIPLACRPSSDRKTELDPEDHSDAGRALPHGVVETESQHLNYRGRGCMGFICCCI